VAIAALVLGILTVGAGISLLVAGGSAHRAAGAESAGAESAGAGPAGAEPAGNGPASNGPASNGPASNEPTSRLAGSEALNSGPAEDHPVSTAAVQITDLNRLPPIPRPRVSTPAGAHPLLEFSHPALAITGLACWFGYVFGRDLPVAWLAIVIWGVTAGSGLRWLVSNVLAARRRGPGSRRSFPRWLVLAHGLAAAAVLSLALLTALTVAHS
jgi:hypothetical protein